MLKPDLAKGDSCAELSAREREVMRLLSLGLTTRETAVELGIASPTLKTHLATIRTKLGVRSTAHALLLSERRGWAGSKSETDYEIEVLAEKTEFLSDLATSLRDCTSFSGAWDTLNSHVAGIGVHSINFGLVAEPVGTVTNGMRSIAMSLPQEVRQLYAHAGGATTDPFMRVLALGARFLVVAPEAPPPEGVKAMTAEFHRFREALCDHRITVTLGSTSRDNATGAPFAMPWNVHFDHQSEIDRQRNDILALNRDVGTVFWRMIQGRELLRDKVPLTNRQREALQNAARGFTSIESSERMGISTRALEKLLEHARAAFGAPTTAAAIFRAGVFRALA
jgi:DNA-binding CsgD family transcriptional regulator